VYGQRAGSPSFPELGILLMRHLISIALTINVPYSQKRNGITSSASARRRRTTPEDQLRERLNGFYLPPFERANRSICFSGQRNIYYAYPLHLLANGMRKRRLNMTIARSIRTTIVCCSLLLIFLPSTISAQSAISDAVVAQHGNLFPTHHTNIDIVSRVANGQDVKLKFADTFQSPVVSDYEMTLPTYPDLEMLRLACDADTVVVATVSASRSAITPSGNFVFTDLVLKVSSVLKGSPGDDIIVTRPGGALTVDGHSVEVSVVGFPPFKSGTPYLLFLRYLPQSNSFRAFKDGSFVLTPFPATLDGQRLGMNSASSATGFLTEVRAAVASTTPCSKLAKALDEGGNQ
jgi:hypothetical protein